MFQALSTFFSRWRRAYLVNGHEWEEPVETMAWRCEGDEVQEGERAAKLARMAGKRTGQDLQAAPQAAPSQGAAGATRATRRRNETWRRC